MKNILITGASHGVGRAVAEELAERGAFFILAGDKDEVALNDAAQAIRSLNENASVETALASVSNRNAMSAVFDRFAEMGGIDTLINCAGISYIGLLQDMTAEQWDEIIGVNLTGVFNTSSFAIPQMLRVGCGRILNISSVWGVAGASCEAAYSASKGGVNALTKALAKELAPSHISVNAIACGFIDTRMNDHLSLEEKEKLFEEIPAGRAGTGKEVAQFALKLLESPEYLTGQIINFDGGWI